MLVRFVILLFNALYPFTAQMLLGSLCKATSLPTCPLTPCMCLCRCYGGSRCMHGITTCSSKWWQRTSPWKSLLTRFKRFHFPSSPPLCSQAAVAASQPPHTSPAASPASAAHQPAQPDEAVPPPLGPDPAQNPLQENQPANPIQMNAQGGPVLNDDELNHDWLDWLYTVSRAGVLLSIVYFYSSFSRFVMVVGAMLLVYLWVQVHACTQSCPETRHYTLSGSFLRFSFNSPPVFRHQARWFPFRPEEQDLGGAERAGAAQNEEQRQQDIREMVSLRLLILLFLNFTKRLDEIHSD